MIVIDTDALKTDSDRTAATRFVYGYTTNVGGELKAIRPIAFVSRKTPFKPSGELASIVNLVEKRTPVEFLSDVLEEIGDFCAEHNIPHHGVFHCSGDGHMVVTDGCFDIIKKMGATPVPISALRALGV